MSEHVPPRFEKQDELPHLEDASPCEAASCGCSPSCGQSSLDRRGFLKVVATGAASASLAVGDAVMAGPFRRPRADVKHFIPADKKLSARWIQGLYARGEPRICRGKELDTIGMPVGGICAGQLYLRGDGTLGVWQIFNKHHFTGYGADSYKYRTVDSPIDQGFAVVLEAGEGKQAVPLDQEHFPGTEFVGEYPIGKVSYAKEGFPLGVELEAFSPFIPLNAKDSGLPATILQFTLENRTDRIVKAAMAGWLENAVCFHTAQDVRGLRRTTVGLAKGRSVLSHSAGEAPAAEKAPSRPQVVLADFEGQDYGEWTVEGEAFGSGPARGTLPGQQQVSGFQGKGLVNTFLDGDKTQGKLTSPPFTISRRYINFLVGGGNHAGRTCMNLLCDGKVVRTAHGASNERLTWKSWNVSDLEGKKGVLEIVDQHSGGWGHINVDQIELADERRGGATGPIEKLEDFGTMAFTFAGPASPAGAGGAALGREDVPWVALKESPGGEGFEGEYPVGLRKKSGLVTEALTLKPGERRTLTFVLTWFFPNRPQGNAYARHFKAAGDVAHYVLDDLSRLAGDTRKWRDTYYESTLPRWLLDRLHSTVSNLATGTCQWWGNGRFWAWEGVGCCSGTCTHVWNYAHGLARLFPELERSARQMQDLGEALHPDGLIGFRGLRNGHYAADGQAGTILKCYREHQMSADGAFLKQNWPLMKKALEYSIRQDANADGLIENSQHNTFDINFIGPNTFVGGLYLAALRAGEEMAKEVGDQEFASRVRKIFESGSRRSSELLWNGEYFIQRVDLEKHPRHQYGDGCLSDQVFGQGWAHQVGLGHIYREEHAKQALRSVWKYNWAPDVAPHNAAYKPERWFVSPGEAGLFTCTWPRSAYLKEGVRYRNEVWTGIEYQVAGHMVWEGMLTEALAICRAIHERYDPAKHNPYNEVECGDHYARALASWGVFTALSGYRYHGPRGFLGFAPNMTPEDFRSAFTTAEGWGSFTQKVSDGRQEDTIALAWGTLRVRTLAFRLAGNERPVQVKVEAAGKPLEVTSRREGETLWIDLGGDVTLRGGEAIHVAVT